MSKITRTNQGGIILTFALIAAGLAIVVFGVLYLVVWRGEQARQGQSIAEAESIVNDQPASNPAPADESPTPTENTAQSSAEAPSGPSELPNTGGLDTSIVEVAAAGIITATVVSYVASRRRLAATL